MSFYANSRRKGTASLPFRGDGRPPERSNDPQLNPGRPPRAPRNTGNLARLLSQPVVASQNDTSLIHHSIPSFQSKDHHTQPHHPTMFSRVAASSVRIAARGVRHATTVSAEGGKNEFKALRDATKAHAAGESEVRSRRGLRGGEWSGMRDG